MRVVVDGIVFENPYQIGIRRIFSEVMQRSAAQLDYTLWLRKRPICPLPDGVRVLRDWGRTSVERWNIPGRALGWWGRRRYPQALRDTDIFHTTYFTPCPVPGPASVVSVYDMVAETELATPGGEVWAKDVQRKRAAILSAKRCVAISQATAADLIRFYPQVADRVSVISLGADHLSPKPARPPGLAPPDKMPFALFVGRRKGYKNFQTLLEAVRLPTWPASLSLLLAGPPLDDTELKQLADLGIAEKVHGLGFVSDADLGQLYSAARCFIFPSLMEGFGIPVLEAQTHGCPAVLSDIPVFHEVAGSGAVFFDARNPQSLAEAVVRACEPDVRWQLINAAHDNRRRFTWERTAAAHVALYEKLRTVAS